MLPSAPDVSNLPPVLQQWAGLIAFILIIAGMAYKWFSILKSNKQENREQDDNPFGHSQKYYFEGPISEMFKLLNAINESVIRIERTQKDYIEDARSRRRR